MTIPGLVDKADDKEKLVLKVEDVATIMPKRDRLNKIKNKRHILRLIVSLALILLLLSTIFLTICYIKKIGPFKRIFRGGCLVGSERYGHHKVMESFEITDDYALLNVPRVHIKWGSFQSVKTLHVFKKKLTVIQFNGVCFVRPMFKLQGLQKDWYEKIGHMEKQRNVPQQFTHTHWQMIPRLMSNEYLRKNVHNLAAAMCLSRPIYNLKFYFHSQNMRRPCVHKCEDCELSRQVYKWEKIEGKICRVCQCKPLLKSSNRVDPNCKTIRCENTCGGKKLLGCVQCKCADSIVEKVPKPNMVTLEKAKVKQLIIEDKAEQSHPEIQTFEDKSKISSNGDISSDDAPTTLPTFQDLSVHHQNYFDAGAHNRKKRSADVACKIVAEIFEGYNPMDNAPKMPVDYIHDC